VTGGHAGVLVVTVVAGPAVGVVGAAADSTRLWLSTSWRLRRPTSWRLRRPAANTLRSLARSVAALASWSAWYSGYCADLRLSQRAWTCPGCGKLVDRNANAALNLRDWTGPVTDRDVQRGGVAAPGAARG
jgi:hypothetical protein